MFLKPAWGGYIFLANVWLLSYPHTVATYQRSYFTFKKNRFLLGFIFLIFVSANAWVYKNYDLVMLMNGYFYLQYFHYFRQNYGISKINSKHWSLLDSWLFHLVNIFGLLALWTDGVTFFGYGLVRFEIFQGQEFLFFVTLGIYLLKIVLDYFKHKNISIMLPIHLILLTITVTLPKYFLLGWLGLHLFHNIQYLLMNWQLNKRVHFIWSYLKAVFIVVVLYRTAFRFDQAMNNLLPFSFIIILSVNYSHYFFDTYLWKRKYRESFP